MRIINYCSGGLGNRLKPFSSCGVISKLTGRKLGVLWKPTMRCQTDFHDLFKNEVELFDNDSLAALSSVEIFSERPYIVHDANLNNMRGLLNLSSRYNVRSLSETATILNSNFENIIVYNNDYLIGYDKESTTSFLKELKPLDFIQSEIDSFCNLNQIDRTVIGVHVRGTDFENLGNALPSVISGMERIQGRFFVCSDSLEYENALKSRFGDRVIFRKKNSYVYKNNPSASWVNNVQTPKESVQESLIDLYILSRTNFQIYNAHSTFAHVALDLSSSLK